MARVRSVFGLPVALGFGLKSPDQLDSLSGELRPDAAVFGSSLLKHLRTGKAPADFMRVWTGCRI